MHSWARHVKRGTSEAPIRSALMQSGKCLHFPDRHLDALIAGQAFRERLGQSDSTTHGAASV